MRYKLLNSQDNGGQWRENVSRSKETNGRTYFVIVFILGALFLCYAAIANDLKPLRMGTSALDSLAYSFNLHKPFRVVVIDAGSTGSRLLAFTFHSALINNNLILDNELYLQTTPGLGAFANDPKAGAESLAKLINEAKATIPESELAETPLTVRATAGLRLLPQDKADALLNECLKLLEKSGFFVTKDSISIMEGADEGIFGWFTVNFLLNRFSSQILDGTVAALDLGGGSTQVTFEPSDDYIHHLGKHIYAINAFGRNMSVYTHSHLGMGLMAARKEILTYGMNAKDYEHDGVIQINSECINPIISKDWKYGGRNYLVKGSTNRSHKIVKAQNYGGTAEDRPVVRFPECKKIISNYVARIKDKSMGLKDHQIYAFSYYFDRATEAGLIDPHIGGVVSVDEFQKAALTTCDYPNTEQPFVCLDLTFISVLLQEGFGLDSTTKLHLYKKLDGHELSWALGAAFSLLNKNH